MDNPIDQFEGIKEVLGISFWVLAKEPFGRSIYINSRAKRSEALALTEALTDSIFWFP